MQYLYKPQPGNTTAVMLMNNGDAATDLLLTFAAVPGIVAARAYAVRDVWRRLDLGTITQP